MVQPGLNDRQLRLLHRIHSGDDLSGPDGVSYRTSARGLQRRGLINVSLQPWRATITDTGVFYLEDLRHLHDSSDVAPAEPATRRREPASPASAQPSSAFPAQGDGPDRARELIEHLQREGGTLRLEHPDEDTRARYRRAIDAAKRRKLIPDGFHLMHTGRDRGDLIIRLSDDAKADDGDWNRIRLNTRPPRRTRLSSPEPALIIAALEQDPAALEVAATSLGRGLALIRLLAEEACTRGHRFDVNRKTVHPKPFLQVGSVQRYVTIREEYDSVPYEPTDAEREFLRTHPRLRLPETGTIASGRLSLQIARTGRGNHDNWADDDPGRLEERIPEIFDVVEAGVAADEQARRAETRRYGEYLDRIVHEEEEERRQWQAALAEARGQALETVRRRTFRAAYDDWAAATAIRAFADALDQAPRRGLGQARARNRERWIAWARAAADQLDPTIRADFDFDAKPTPDDLRLHLNGWSPHEPEQETRWERDDERLAVLRCQAESWYLGMS
ncbi:hypothetical protein ACG83_00120 [Frankia sp. R43]|uniref:hypothetical protein n=1 Tax=Frankia sp. R43 TaxID=269536 RepID=UPI0006C9F9F3|nr:hypothetical protein [Frankia sp. R43]KPM56415.1 hypothetical protein ACG83_00120 [Frankia sp. R43]